MAIQTLPSVYGVVELNHIASVRTGQIKAQYTLNSTDFATTPAQNGMLLVVNEFAGTIDLPEDANSYCWLHSSVEKDYEDKGRKYFCLTPDDFRPRLYKLYVGDVFETNCISYDDTVYANYAAIVAAINATTVYGVPSTTGHIRITASTAGTETVVLKAKAGVTLPNGEPGIKFIVQKA